MAYRTMKVCGSLLAVLLLPLSVSASEELYKTSFEAAEGFAAGTYNAGQTVGSWDILAGTAVVGTSTTPDSSTQVVTLSDGAQFDRDLTPFVTAPPSGLFLEGYYRGAGSSLELKDATYPTDEPASAIIHFSSAKGIQALDGAATGDARYVTVDVALGSGGQNTWHKMTVYLDFTAKTWDLWVDDAIEAQNLGFRDNTVTTLSGFRNLSETSTGFDAFRVVRPIQGDANGDGELDAADVVTTAEYTLGGTVSPILLFNADVDGTPGVTAGDVEMIADLITTL